MVNIDDYPLSERKKRFDEIIEGLPTDSPFSAEDMIRELAILRKGYYDPHSWGFAEEEEKR